MTDKTIAIRNRRLFAREGPVRDREARAAEEEQQQLPPPRRLKVGIDAKPLECDGCEHCLCRFCFMSENELKELDGDD